MSGDNKMRSRILFIWLITACAILFLAAKTLIDTRERLILAATPEKQLVQGGTPLSNPPSRIRFAKGFSIEYFDTHKVVHVHPPWRDGTGETFTYILTAPGHKVPDTIPGSTVIPLPVRRLVVTSTTCLPFLKMLDEEETLVGVSGCKRVSTPQVIDLIRQNKIAEISGGGDGMVTHLDFERLYTLRPDLVIVYGTGIAEYDNHPKLIEAGFRTVVFSNHMESTPLGRAEWIKFIAAFFDKEAEAERIFDKIADAYEAQAEMARTRQERPSVFSGLFYRNSWYVAGGGSYVATFITDAGGDYVWRDDRTSGSIPLDMEVVVDRTREADYWLDPGIPRSLEELRATDERFAVLKSFRNGNVYSNDAKTNGGGGNDFWETGVARPDLVLADLISIFHPELMLSHRLEWYRRLPPRTGSER